MQERQPFEEDKKEKKGRFQSSFFDWGEALIVSLSVIVLLFTFVVRLIGVDGYRLAIRTETVKYDGEDISFIVPKKTVRELIKLLNPVAPHITEEINEMCACCDGELMHAPWPVCDESALVKSTVEIAMQINGKVRGRMNVPADLTRDGAAEYFMALDEIKKLVGDKPVKKLVFVPGRLVNIVM